MSLGAQTGLFQQFPDGLIRDLITLMEGKFDRARP